jgi:hypothetical protein
MIQWREWSWQNRKYQTDNQTADRAVPWQHPARAADSTGQPITGGLWKRSHCHER